MISLRIENSKVEEIFLDGFGSDKASFFQFIIDSFEKKKYLDSLDRSCKQAILQQNGEIEEKTLQDIID